MIGLEAGIVILLAAGCSSPETPDEQPVSTAAQNKPTADLTVMEKLRRPGKCVQLDTPDATDPRYRVVMRGTVAEVSEGVVRSNSRRPNRKPDKVYILKIAIDDVARGADWVGFGADDAYLILWRGLDPSAVPSINEVKEALPAGTDLIAYTNPMWSWGVQSDDMPDDVAYIDQVEGVPAERLLFNGFGRCAQVITYSQGQNELLHWKGRTFKDLVSDLKQFGMDRPAPAIFD